MKERLRAHQSEGSINTIQYTNTAANTSCMIRRSSRAPTVEVRGSVVARVGGCVGEVSTVPIVRPADWRRRDGGHENHWCLGPESNRHGVSPKGFSYHCSFRR